jgi:hypothetical protein
MRAFDFRHAAPAVAISVALVFGQAGAAPTVPPPSVADDMPMADYLGLLAQIAPAAEEGAKAYVQAFQQRCGRPLSSADLRQAMSAGDGDPVLMSMIRAAHLRDATALARLGSRVACERQASR